MSTPPNTAIVRAPGKVNLFLRVIGRRPDDYHNVQTLVAPIGLADKVRVHAFADPGMFRTLSLSLEVTGDPALTRGVPVDETNLVLRAARRLAEATGVRGFAEFVLDKAVPPAAGLGGGSADAAAALRSLNELWGCGLDASALREVGASVGSDVPALLAGGPAVARGRGELVESAVAPGFEWVVVTFSFSVSTAQAFGWWDEDAGPTGPDPARLLGWLRASAAPGMAGRTRERLRSLMYNDLQGPVMRRHPQIQEARDRLVAAGAVAALMCGSGPSVAAILPDGRTELGKDAERDLRRISGGAVHYVASEPS